MTAPIYLDHAATTPMRPAAVEAMLPYFTERFHNPSGSYRCARDARRAVDDARDQVAAAVGCLPGEVVFTGCGTESDNTAISGATWHHGGHPVCTAVEHHAVLHAVERHDGKVVGVDRAGRVDLDQLATAADGAAIVSVMTVNNEVGTINDLAAVRRAVPDVAIHTDAIQASSWLDLRQVWRHVDAMSLSGHKFGGPKGVGILVLRTDTVLDPLIVGGGQERARRSGTHNVAGIVAAATALAETDAHRDDEVAATAARRDRLVAGLRSAVDGVHETVDPADKIAGNAHLLIAGVESESLLFLLDQAGVCASAASACSSGALQTSHVLAAMGVDCELARGAIRFTLGHTTTDDEIDRAVGAIAEAITTLRSRTTPRVATS